MPTIQFPEKLRPLFAAWRYKILYGGRGGAKSWGIARALLLLGAQKPLRVICAREIQKSISDSVHKLLKDQIENLGLGAFYDVQQNIIRGQNGTEFTFHGLKHNVANIKSVEGCDVCWVEEAQTVSKNSWATLIPTIRKAGSEIWVSFNPELDTDETYRRFIVSPPTDSVIIKVNWSDNPWFPAILKQEMLDLKARDEDAYLTVWEGHCKQVLDGAIYAKEVRQATLEGRFRSVPHQPGVPVHTVWDLGRSDMTAIWFVQMVGHEIRMIDYYEDRGYALGHYLDHVKEKSASLGYVYGDDWLPHDATHKLLASQRTIEQQARAFGRSVRIAPMAKVADGINAARTVFARCFFDETRTADGIQCLRRYRFDVDPETGQFSKNPLHDAASHGADAFRYVAVALADPPPTKSEDKRPRDRWSGAFAETAATGWKVA